MLEFLSRLTPADTTTLLAMALVLLFGTVISIALIWFKIRHAEIAANLKQDMLNRGMSAEEIKTVLEAGPKK